MSGEEGRRRGRPRLGDVVSVQALPLHAVPHYGQTLEELCFLRLSQLPHNFIHGSILCLPVDSSLHSVVHVFVPQDLELRQHLLAASSGLVYPLFPVVQQHVRLRGFRAASPQAQVVGLVVPGTCSEKSRSEIFRWYATVVMGFLFRLFVFSRRFVFLGYRVRV